MTNSSEYVPFSQRNGFRSSPPQLEVGEVSPELRRLLDYYLSLEIEREECSGYHHNYFEGKWERLSKDLHVEFFEMEIKSYENKSLRISNFISLAVNKSTIDKLFDFIEFFLQHAYASGQLKNDLAKAFVASRSAYRVVDNLIIAIGTSEQAEAFERAIGDAEAIGASAARTHLIAAGQELRKGDWAGSIRESMHAVEAMARRIATGTKTLGPALRALDDQGHLHGSLKLAFEKLYGFSCDEEGIRHALVFQDEANVDEADALFMLGACASFVSYLVARSKTVAA